MKHKAALIIYSLVLFSACVTTRQGPGVLPTLHTRIFYRHPGDIRQLAWQGGLGSAGKLRGEVDALWKRAWDILLEQQNRPITDSDSDGMVDINLYQNQDELAGVYMMVMGREGREIAFYVAKTNTIYLSLEDMTRAVLVHEMVHAIIDKIIRPLPLF